MNITYKMTNDGVDWEHVADILDRSGLSHYSPNIQEKIFTNSDIVLYVYDDERLIGVARALSDGVCQGSIYNVALDEQYQGYGIGRSMIEHLLEKMTGQCVILYTHPQTVALYEKLGFRRGKTAMEYFDLAREHLEWMDGTGFFLPDGYRFSDEYGREDMNYHPPKHKQ